MRAACLGLMLVAAPLVGGGGSQSDRRGVSFELIEDDPGSWMYRGHVVGMFAFCVVAP